MQGMLRGCLKMAISNKYGKRSKDIQLQQSEINGRIDELNKGLVSLEVEKKDIEARIRNVKLSIRALQIERKNMMNLNIGVADKYKLIFER